VTIKAILDTSVRGRVRVGHVHQPSRAPCISIIRWAWAAILHSHASYSIFVRLPLGYRCRTRMLEWSVLYFSALRSVATARAVGSAFFLSDLALQKSSKIVRQGRPIRIAPVSAKRGSSVRTYFVVRWADSATLSLARHCAAIEV